MKTFTNDEMNALLVSAQSYSLVILKPGPNSGDDTSPAIMLEHGRRNFGMLDAGVVTVSLTVLDGSEIFGRCGRGVHLRGAPLPRIRRKLAAVIGVGHLISVTRSRHATDFLSTTSLDMCRIPQHIAPRPGPSRSSPASTDSGTRMAE
jgi:hypothetical protein